MLVSLAFGQSSSCLVFARTRYFAGSTWYVKSRKGKFVEGKHLVSPQLYVTQTVSLGYLCPSHELCSKRACMKSRGGTYSNKYDKVFFFLFAFTRVLFIEISFKCGVMVSFFQYWHLFFKCIQFN